MANSHRADFPRVLKVGFEETDLALAYFARKGVDSMVMLDVGAHHGTSTTGFAQDGWRVYAFEPDPTNRAGFVRNLARFDNVTVDPRAVSDIDGNEVTLYDSDESSGITSLLAFTDGHQPLATVKTVRLDTFMIENSITEVDFLKMDTEGFDLMVLRGFPWEQVRPPVVLCEYEDNKTNNLGYTTGDMIDFLLERSYTVLVSEWHPIERYGIAHSFRRIFRYDGTVPSTSSWGNLLAVAEPSDAEYLLDLAPAFFERKNGFADSPWRSFRFEAWMWSQTRSAGSRSDC